MPQIQETAPLNHMNSEELQEIVGQPPKGIVRWGTGTFVFVLLIIMSVSLLVQYVDVLNGKATLTAANSPKSVVAKTDGKLVKLLVKENDLVEQGQILAYLESSASHEEVIRLAGELDNRWMLIRKGSWQELFSHQPTSYQQLGELQSAYQAFIVTYIQMDAYLGDQMYEKKKNLLRNEMANLAAQRINLEEQDAVSKKDFEIAEKDFKAKKQLFEEKVISALEFRQEESKFLNKKVPAMHIRSSMIQNNTAIANKQQELIQFEQEFADQKSTFLQALNTLISNLDEWKKKFLLIAPEKGKVTLPVLLQDKQDVKSGQELFYITPANSDYYAEIWLPQANAGKLKTGQQVLISLNSFPYAEYGKLRGSVNFISEFPDKDNQYYLSVKLDNGLQTDRGKIISYRNGLTGTGEIITSKSRVINKFLYTFREMLNRPGTPENSE